MAGDTKPVGLTYDDEKKPSSPSDSKSQSAHQLSELSGSEEGAYEDESNPFRDPVAAQHWREVYEKSKYECRHVFDPSLTWTEEEEKISEKARLESLSLGRTSSALLSPPQIISRH